MSSAISLSTFFAEPRLSSSLVAQLDARTDDAAIPSISAANGAHQMHVVAIPKSIPVPPDSFPKSLESARLVASHAMETANVSDVSFSLYDELDDEGLVENILLLRWGFKRFGDTVILVELDALGGRASLEPDVVRNSVDISLRELRKKGYFKLCLQNSDYAFSVQYLLEQPASVREPLELWAPRSLHDAIASHACELGYVLE